jgi:hypothetical protein
MVCCSPRTEGAEEEMTKKTEKNRLVVNPFCNYGSPFMPKRSIEHRFTETPEELDCSTTANRPLFSWVRAEEQ